MKLSTGLEAIPIEFDNGEKTAIYINPADPQLAVRIKAMLDNFSAMNERFGATMMADIDAYNAVNQEIAEQIDATFGAGTASAVFQFVSPLAAVDNEPFVAAFLRGILGEIDKRTAKIKKRMDEHLAKYSK